MRFEQEAIKVSWLSIIGNILLALIKGITGAFGNSYALVADAVESTSDIFASFIIFLGLKYSSKPADRNHPYGHGKAEPLIAFLVALSLILSAVIIIYNSIQNIRTPHESPKKYTLIVLGLVIITKEVFFRIVSRKSRETRSVLLKSEAWHHRSDAITSLAAFIGVSIALVFGEGYESADDWAALLAAAFILYNSYLIFRPALGEVMDENIYDDFISEIVLHSKTVGGIMKLEKCFVRKSGLKFHISLNISVDGSKSVSEGHMIAHRLQDRLKEIYPNLETIVIHVEPHE